MSKALPLIRRLQQRDLAIIYVSHFLEEVREIADSFTVLRDGRSVGEGSIEEASSPRDCEAHGRSRDSGDVSALEACAGRCRSRSVGARRAGPPSLASFELRRSEVLGIAGLMGAGRTEMVRTILDFVGLAWNRASRHGDGHGFAASPARSGGGSLERRSPRRRSRRLAERCAEPDPLASRGLGPSSSCSRDASTGSPKSGSRSSTYSAADHAREFPSSLAEINRK